MFELYRLRGSALLPRHLATRDDNRELLLIHGIAFPPQPMLLLRQALAHCFAHYDAQEKQAIYENHEFLLSLVFGGVNTTEATRAYQKVQYRQLAARLESNLTHNLALSSQLIEESANLIERLFSSRKIRIAISDYSRLDDMSTRLIFELIKRHDRIDIQWVVGLPEAYHTLPRIEVHGEGIQWLPPMQNHRGALYGLKDCIPFSEFNAEISAAYLSPEHQESDQNYWDATTLAEEDLAWDVRAIHVIYPQAAPTDDEWFILYSAACHAFQLFAFASALFFAQHAIAMGRGFLSAQRRATLHGICALAAHNRQFFAEQNPSIGRYILNQLSQAIALEEQATVRCAHWYRLAVTEGRRMGHTGRALAYVSDGFGEIGRGLMSRQEALLAEAWLYNIKGYCLSREHQPQSAEEAMVMSFKILEGIDFSGTGLEDEARLTLAVTVENTMKLMRHQAQVEKWQNLQQTAETLSSPWPVFGPAHLAEKADLAIFKLDLKQAIEHARAGIQASIVQYNAPQRQYFTTMVAELYLRAQMWPVAIQHFLQALALPESLDLDHRPSTVPISIACARAMLGAGQLEQAQHMLEQCWQEYCGETASQSKEIVRLKFSDRILLTGLRMECAHALNQTAVLQQRCDELIAMMKELPEITHLTAVNAYIATVAWQRADHPVAQAAAHNAWEHGRPLLQALCEKRLQPSTYLLDAVLKAYLHPVVAAGHDEQDWRQIFELVASTLRSHTISWLYLDPVLTASKQYQREKLLWQTEFGQCFQRALETRSECQFLPAREPLRASGHAAA